MNKLLFLDDYRSPIDCANYMYKRNVDCKIYHMEWNIVRSYREFINWIEKNGLPDLISFDHDLGDVVELLEELPKEHWFDSKNKKEYTGLNCAKWLVEYCLKNNKPLPQYIVHSTNVVGRENIEKYLYIYTK